MFTVGKSDQAWSRTVATEGWEEGWAEERPSERLKFEVWVCDRV